MPMEASEVMELFDSCWFHKDIFKNHSISLKPSRSHGFYSRSSFGFGNYFPFSTKQKWIGKSLSEFEYKELKGFMDMGFVFREEDTRNPNLVSLVPGLWKEDAIPWPSPSEAWEEANSSKKRENPFVNWRTSSSNNDEIDMKGELRWWAYSVASALRFQGLVGPLLGAPTS